MSNKTMSHIDYVLRHRCPICKMSITFEDFRDKHSISEYKLSGICQWCQDDIISEEYGEVPSGNNGPASLCQDDIFSEENDEEYEDYY